MRKIVLLFVGIIAALNLFAQSSNLIFYTENGEKFYVILNGIKQNATPETNVKVTDLNANTYKAKIIFENTTFGAVDKTLFFNQGNETTFAIIKSNKGEYVVRFRSEVPLAQAPATPPTQTAVVYTTVPATSVSTTVTHTETSTGGGEGVSMGVNMNGVGVDMNINVNDGGMTNTSSSTTYSTTTTTTTTTGGQVVNPTPVQVVYVPGYSGPVGCPAPMSPGDFAGVKQSIESKTFEDSKLTIAKQVISANCLLCSQVREIMMLFSFEDTRLELAKFAYRQTYDIGNYYKLNDAFKFESSIDELNEYIQGGH